MRYWCGNASIIHVFFKPTILLHRFYNILFPWIDFFRTQVHNLFESFLLIHSKYFNFFFSEYFSWFLTSFVSQVTENNGWSDQKQHLNMNSRCGSNSYLVIFWLYECQEVQKYVLSFFTYKWKCNSFHFRKLRRSFEFKFLTKLSAFHIVIMLFKK